MSPFVRSFDSLRRLRASWSPQDRADLFEGLRRGSLIGIATLAVVLPPQVHSVRGISPLPSAATPTAQGVSVSVPAPRTPRFADFGSQEVSADARYLANWIADSRDNAGSSFVIVDKKHTAVLLFDPQARLVAATPVLLGSAPGDDTVPGIGTRPLELVRPEERTTPAGRFIAELGRNALGEDVVWVDYDAAVSMHRVRTTNASERRLERLATPTTDDNRISYGCINVPVAFYEAHLQPTFAQRRAIVYVLPEVRSIEQVFGAYDVAVRHGVVRDVPLAAGIRSGGV